MQAWFLQPGQQPSDAHRAKALAWQQQLTKPAGSLGRLEELAVELAALQHRKQPELKRVNICVFAADHGVCEENISAYPQPVTAQMVENFANGGAAISVLAKKIRANFEVVNLGTVQPLGELQQVLNEIIAPVSGNIARAEAMTHLQLTKAMAAGRDAVVRAAETGCDLFVAGEMGIGNTTVATAVLARLLATPASALVGPGSGIAPAQLAHKAAVIESALAFHAGAKAPLEALRCLGGFDLAALVGSYIACAQAKIPVLLDGFICGVAALVACRINTSVRPWLLQSHRSAEPAHQIVLEQLSLRPLLDLQLRLGEASGAAVAVPLLRIACELHNNMATFAEAGIAT